MGIGDSMLLDVKDARMDKVAKETREKVERTNGKSNATR